MLLALCCARRTCRRRSAGTRAASPTSRSTGSDGHGSLYGDYWVDRPPLLLALFKLAVLGGDDGVRALGALAAVALVIAVTLLARAVAGPRRAGSPACSPRC